MIRLYLQLGASRPLYGWLQWTPCDRLSLGYMSFSSVLSNNLCQREKPLHRCGTHLLSRFSRISDFRLGQNTDIRLMPRSRDVLRQQRVVSRMTTALV